ncbi:MAG: molybdopterin molybdotransferase MoeA [Syntrophales bacterium]|jgi:molybdopterin molybdotransferase|nr:molybdopterin molybdotransferase MoeA [Syntrophales bacterium]
MIRVDEALKTILANVVPLPVEKVNILAALGRVLGEDIVAPRHLPPTNNSSMDGYAVRARDTGGAKSTSPVILNVIEDIPAGTVPRKAIAAGQASRIMTGAPLPEGADAVVRMEDTQKDGHQVRIHVEARQGLDIRLAGEDVQEGETVIFSGSVIRPAEVGMLAALGRSFVSVYQRPVVAILATGDELVDIDEPPSSWKIISSNSYATAAQVMESGAAVLQLGIVKDRRENLIEKFRAATRADLIISSGGVSVGDYDLVKDIMKEVGNAMQFWQVAMRPGKPLAFGSIQGVPVFGLPGNPVSSMISFEQFVRPTILKMMGHKNLYRKMIRATLEEDLAKKEGMRYFMRGQVRWEAGRYYVRSTGEQGSGILKSMVRANGLMVLPEQTTSFRKGEEVFVQLLDRSMEQNDHPDYA